MADTWYTSSAGLNKIVTLLGITDTWYTSRVGLIKIVTLLVIPDTWYTMRDPENEPSVTRQRQQVIPTNVHTWLGVRGGLTCAPRTIMRLGCVQLRTPCKEHIAYM